MARSNFRDVIATPDSNGNLIVLDDVQVHVYNAGTTDAVNIFSSRNPLDLVPLTNPITTDATGIVDFWAEAGDYDIFVHDTHGPPRILDQTFGWAPLSGADHGVPSNKIAVDGGLSLGTQGSDIMRQHAPIGSVVAWWRPSSTYNAGAGAGLAPPGWAICDGTTYTSGQHDFGAFSITLPDLRNKFIIGADILKTDSTASTPGDGTAIPTAQHPNAPGIRGVGGANASKNLAHSHQFGHTHGVPHVSHTHNTLGIDHLHTAGSIYTPDHAHGAGSLFAPSGASRATLGLSNGSGIPESMAWGNHGHPTDAGATAGPGNITSGGATAGADRGLTATSDGGTSIASTTNSQSTTTTDNGTIGTTIDMRPSHVGLLMIMKIRRS